MCFAAFEGFPNRKGSGTRIRQTVTALAEAGAQVTLLTLRGDPDGPESPPGVRHRPLRILEDNYLSRALAFRDAVGRALYAERPDVVHVRGPFEGQAAATYADARGAAFVFEVNGLPSVELRYHHPRIAEAVDFQRKIRALEERLLRRADLVLTQSQATARFVRLRAKTPLPVAVLPNGAEPGAPPGPRPAGGPLDALYIGSLAPWQGLLDVLTAARQARREADLRLTFVGPGRKPWVRALQAAARRLKVQDILTIEDALAPEPLAARVRAADVCLAPLAQDTRNRVQGCSPIKLFDYMAAGRAVLASDLPCVREIVRPDETGLLHRASHPGRLRDGLLALAEDPRARARMGAAARRFVLAGATWAHRRATLATIYAERVPSGIAARASA